MDEQQKQEILYLYHKAQKEGKSNNVRIRGKKKSSINLSFEKRFSSLMNSLSSEEWEEANALLQKEHAVVRTKKEKKKKTKNSIQAKVNDSAGIPEPIQSIQERFLNKGLLKGFKKMKSSNVNYYDMEPFILNQVQIKLSQGCTGEVLSLIFESGRTFNLDIISLLKKLFTDHDYPTFLKHAHRFNVYSELKNEIEEAIKWHNDTNKPDAFAWRVKFDSIAQEEKLLTESASIDSYVKICEDESIEHKKLVTIKLTPIYRKGVKTGDHITEDTQKYIEVQYDKCKLDQANASHRETQTILESYLDIFSVSHYETKHIDVFAEINGVSHIFEVKSITLRNEGTQTREGVGQLHEYAYLYGIDSPRFFLVYSSKPETEWLIDYLQTRESINVLWVDETQKNSLAGPGLKLLEQECLRYYKDTRMTNKD